MSISNAGVALRVALEKLGSGLEVQAPFLAEALRDWICRISPTGEPEGHFEHPRMFPIIPLPEWVVEGLGASRDPAFHEAVTYSSVCGYYYTRLVDNFMDGDVEVKGSLLPATGFLASEFQAEYQKYFPARHEFWNRFRTIWLGAAEGAGHDASLRVVTADHFDRISSRKFAAAGIPVTATCYFYERPEAIAGWMQFVDLLGKWSQMFDDVLDWHQDREQGRATWFLSEGERRKRAEELMLQWVAREGSEWGFQLLEHWMQELQRQAVALESAGAQQFLRERESLRREKEKEWAEGFASLAQMASILQMT